jgi:hypothetical protein
MKSPLRRTGRDMDNDEREKGGKNNTFQIIWADTRVCP